jgi:putative membrane protein
VFNSRLLFDVFRLCFGGGQSDNIFLSHNRKGVLNMGWILRFVFSALAVFFASHYIPGIHVNSLGTAFWVAFVLGIINLVIRPIITLLTLPLTILTLGLFSLVVNAVLFWLTSALVKGFEVHGFIAAFLGALVVMVAQWLAHWVASWMAD